MAPRIKLITATPVKSRNRVVWPGTEDELNGGIDEGSEDGEGEDEQDDRRLSGVTIDELESLRGVFDEDWDKQSRWEERLKWWKVYALHFLFMWNSGTFEYVSVSFPNSLGRLAADLKDISCCIGVPRKPYSNIDKVCANWEVEVTC